MTDKETKCGDVDDVLVEEQVSSVEPEGLVSHQGMVRDAWTTRLPLIPCWVHLVDSQEMDADAEAELDAATPEAPPSSDKDRAA